MNPKPLIAYFLILIALCAAFIVGAKMMGEQGMVLAQGYMMTPALAALSYVFFTLFGAIQWDFTGQEF
ncbi:MAG: hypothetical protein AB1649_28565 [Chloroflexota bacterium]